VVHQGDSSSSSAPSCRRKSEQSRKKFKGTPRVYTRDPHTCHFCDKTEPKLRGPISSSTLGGCTFHPNITGPTPELLKSGQISAIRFEFCQISFDLYRPIDFCRGLSVSRPRRGDQVLAQAGIAWVRLAIVGSIIS
jgi:hypothetical protein